MSLLRIALKDFVIVRRLELELQSGFTALTGETGAGKSILIDALQLALGGRADAGVIRQGADRTDVTAEFTATPAVQDWLAAQELDASEATVILRRTVDAQGRSKAWLNGTPATATQLRDLAARLVDIHGQHAWQALTQVEATRDLLDGYAGIDTQPVRQRWQAWREAIRQWESARDHTEQLRLQREQIEWQLSEWQRLSPQAGEWADIQQEHARLAHMQQLLEAAAQAQVLLNDGEWNALQLASRAEQQLAAQAHHEPEFQTLADLLEQSVVLQREVVRALHGYSHRMEADPNRLVQLEQRLALWMAVAKRLGCAPEAVHETGLALQDRLTQLAAAANLEALSAQVQACYDLLKQECQRISLLRLDQQAKLATEITQKIQELGMPGGRFEVVLTPLKEPQPHGLDEIEFRVAGHAGAEPRPIAKVASGGELSRIALAIAVSTSQVHGCPTLIFDEVDSGVGGAVAHTVGRLMADLGQHRQVLAVTHLPQVAACAHHHLQVSKTAQDGHVESDVRDLNGDSRVREIARMLGGAQITDTTLAHAKELLST